MKIKAFVAKFHRQFVSNFIQRSKLFSIKLQDFHSKLRRHSLKFQNITKTSSNILSFECRHIFFRSRAIICSHLPKSTTSHIISGVSWNSNNRNSAFQIKFSATCVMIIFCWWHKKPFSNRWTNLWMRKFCTCSGFWG